MNSETTLNRLKLPLGRRPDLDLWGIGRPRLAELTVAEVWQRLRRAKAWLHLLRGAPWHETGVDLAGTGGFQVRSPSLASDFFRLTSTTGVGTGESFWQFPLEVGDHLLDGYGSALCGAHRRSGPRLGEHVVAALAHAAERTLRSAGQGRRSATRRNDWLVAGPSGFHERRRSGGDGLRRAQHPRGHTHRQQGLAPVGLKRRHAVVATDPYCTGRKHRRHPWQNGRQTPAVPQGLTH